MTREMYNSKIFDNTIFKIAGTQWKSLNVILKHFVDGNTVKICTMFQFYIYLAI